MNYISYMNYINNIQLTYLYLPTWQKNDIIKLIVQLISYIHIYYITTINLYIYTYYVFAHSCLVDTRHHSTGIHTSNDRPRRRRSWIQKCWLLD